MSHQPNDEPFSEANLESPEYRERLMRKLNCLIAVLEVATAKVHKSLAGPSADTERLMRIRSNLQSTLDVCLRARAALERREELPKGLPENLSQVIQQAKAAKIGESQRPKQLTRGESLELRNEEERRKFKRMGPITREQLSACDFEALTRRLQG